MIIEFLSSEDTTTLDTGAGSSSSSSSTVSIPELSADRTASKDWISSVLKWEALDPVRLNMEPPIGFFSRRPKAGIGIVRLAFMGMDLDSLNSAKSPAGPLLDREDEEGSGEFTVLDFDDFLIGAATSLSSDCCTPPLCVS